MRYFVRLLPAPLWLVGLLWSGAVAQGANLLRNAGFEENTPDTGGHAIAGWQWYGQTWNTLVQTDSARAHTGSNYFKVYGDFTAKDNWNGVYQDTIATAGTVYSADAWAFSLSSDGGGLHGQSQIWVEVTFRDGLDKPLALYRSEIVTGSNLANYGGLDRWFYLKVTNQWSFYTSGGVPVAVGITNRVSNLVAPAGTASARFQLLFHQGPDNANGSAYFDDCTLNPISGPGTTWNIVWSDEFNGTSINAKNWTFDIGNGSSGWGNNELEYYTSRAQNAYVSNGLLHIVARKEAYNGFNYTSARMKSQGLFSKKYGRFEFRAKLPAGLGYWPALWLLGTNISSVSWPACGEIDVMENKGSILNQVHGTLHYSDASNNHLQSSYPAFTLPNGGSVTNFHTYLLDWSTNFIRWYIDGQLYQTQTNWSSSTGPYPAPFNQPFFIIMNLAVGGNYLGRPSAATIDANTIFPGALQVDYVRVWDQTAPLQLSLSRSSGNWVLKWPTNIVCRLQVQTNTAGIAANWTDLPGATSPFVVPLNPGNASTFYRLQSP